MSRTHYVERLVLDLQAGRLSRREFVSRASGLGLSVSTIGLVLSACGKSEPPRGAGPDLGEMEKELSICNWSDYVAEDTIPNFEKEFGVRVTYETFESNEEMLARLQASAGGYDVVVPSNHVVPEMIASQLVAPLSRQYLTNLANLALTFVDPVFDPGNRYSIAYQWGTTGYAWRTDRLPRAPDSWSIFHDARLRGKMTMMDDMRDVIGAWLRFRGHSLNSTVESELRQAKGDALIARRNLKAYISAPVKGQLVSGDVWVAQLWNGDTQQARAEQPNIGYTLPREGCTIWTDSLMIPHSAPHKRAAHEFINYVLRPDVGAAISDVTGYGSPNQAALAVMKTPVPYPTAEEFQRLEYQKNLGEAGALWARIWTEIRNV